MQAKTAPQSAINKQQDEFAASLKKYVKWDDQSIDEYKSYQSALEV